MLISINNLTAGYDSRPVLTDVNCKIERGEWIGIIGPNGGGKTTLVKSIVGLLVPIAGSIHYYNKEGAETDTISIGYLPQKSDIDTMFPISVEEVVLSGLMSQLGWWRRPSQAQRRRVAEVLKKTGLTDLRKSSIGALSGGQMQRAMFGRAIVAQPELLVLDEPNSYLDMAFEAQLYDLLKELHSQGATILMVSHELGSVQSLVDRVFSVEGHIVETQPTHSHH
jgi:zinc transport system ATP-binding protein